MDTTPEDTTPEQTTLSRRTVILGAAACAFCAAAEGATTRPAAGAKPTSQPAATPIDAGPLSAFAKDGVYDALAKSQKLLVIRNKGKLYASSSRCTHRNCVLRKEHKDIAELRCPCHDSTFDIDGIPVDGPARTSLPRYGIRIENGRVLVDPSKVFEERAWKDNGASVAVGK